MLPHINLRKQFNFCIGFWKTQDTTKVKLGSQSKLNSALFVWLHWFCLLKVTSRLACIRFLFYRPSKYKCDPFKAGKNHCELRIRVCFIDDEWSLEKVEKMDMGKGEARRGADRESQHGWGVMGSRRRVPDKLQADIRLERKLWKALTVKLKIVRGLATQAPDKDSLLWPNSSEAPLSSWGGINFSL